MNKAILRRVEALEQRVGIDPIVLTLPDGSVRKLPGTTKNFLRISALLDLGTDTPELGWLRDAEAITGPGCEAFNLLGVLLKGPIDAGEDPEILQLIEQKKGAMQ